MPGFLFITLILYGPLFIIGLFFLRKAILVKNKTRIILILAALVFCGYKIGWGLTLEMRFKKDQDEQKRGYYENVPIGDTATMTGWILHRLYDGKEIQDTVEKLNREERVRSGRGFFYIAIMREGQKNWHMKTMETNLHDYNSLEKYMSYYQQLKDTTTYKLTVKAVKISNGESWKLLELLQVDSLKELPKYWH